MTHGQKNIELSIQVKCQLFLTVLTKLNIIDRFE